MKNYDRINALPPKDIERKKAHIVGGGIAGFATAAFLIDDAHMPGENITIYEAEKVHGGCLDAHRFEKGYKNCGSRMWERRYECTYFLLGKIPSIDTPGRTVLDETYQANVDHPFHARTHLMHRGARSMRPMALDVPRGRPEADGAAPEPRGGFGRTDMQPSGSGPGSSSRTSGTTGPTFSRWLPSIP